MGKKEDKKYEDFFFVEDFFFPHKKWEGAETWRVTWVLIHTDSGRERYCTPGERYCTPVCIM